jgi:hypothetical protein
MADMIALRLAKQEGRLDLAEMLDRDRRKAGDKDQDGD